MASGQVFVVNILLYVAALWLAICDKVIA